MLKSMKRHEVVEVSTILAVISRSRDKAVRNHAVSHNTINCRYWCYCGCNNSLGVLDFELFMRKRLSKRIPVWCVFWSKGISRQFLFGNEAIRVLENYAKCYLGV